MKSAQLFVEALEQGMSPADAICSLPIYEPLYIHRVPVEVYRAALRRGWRFFPVPSSRHLRLPHANLFQEATDSLKLLRYWAREWPNWALVTGPGSGVFVLEVNGSAGLASLLELCGDDWGWLETLRSIAGEKRCISFSWPEGRRQIGRGQQFAKGLRIIGEGDWVLAPPSREPNGARHAYLNPGAEALAAPRWLLDPAFGPTNTVDALRPCRSVIAARSNAILAEATHDQI